MTPSAPETLEQVARLRKRAAVAQVGGFKPPGNPLGSWFGTGAVLPSEGLPETDGVPLFPLLQVNVSELPFVPSSLTGCELLVLFMNNEEYPFDKPHGEGWLIREYADLTGLQAFPDKENALPVRPFPIRWNQVDDDLPGWEDCWELVDLSAVNEDPEASDRFFEMPSRYPGTKVGGYPCDIQHGVGIDDFVFQVGSEEKAGWMWADNGVAYFHKNPETGWRWSCQFY